MRYRIVQDIPGRLRLRLSSGILSEDEARGIAGGLREIPGITRAEVHAANGSVLVCYVRPTGSTYTTEPVIKQLPMSIGGDVALIDAYRAEMLQARSVDTGDPRAVVLAAITNLDILALPRQYITDYDSAIELANADNSFALELMRLLEWRVFRRLFLPVPVQMVFTVANAIRYLYRGLRAFFEHGLTVEVLDAAAIVSSVLQGEFAEASVVMFLLDLSNVLGSNVRRRTQLALQEGLVARASYVWAIIDGKEVRIEIDDICKGMVCHIRSGQVFPADGCVVSGEGEVDEASMTGESVLVHKRAGSSVYAGTAIEDGDFYVRVSVSPGESRLDAIEAMVERASYLKAEVQSKAEHLADSLVPFSFLGFISVLLVTRNPPRAVAVLMVDYSCAIKLSTPVAVMSAMREAVSYGIVVKGGKYLEAMAEADTIVFDKTGTLTEASPRLRAVLSLSDNPSEDENYVLRLAACIEEHFPHSMARAICRASDERGLAHQEEMHAQVTYVVAHGIVTHVEGEKVVIGSAHFVFDDEGVYKPSDLSQRLGELAFGCSEIYIARNGVLLGVLCIEDPIRADVADVLIELRELGFSHIVMLTGDSETSARHVAERLGIDEWHAQVLPEDKSYYITQLHDKGHVVAMIGDGINDSPALAAADVSLTLSDASDIARAVSDISILDESFASIATARRIAQHCMARIQNDYHFIVALNTSLIVGGVVGLIRNTTAAYLHNGTTVAIAINNTRSLIGKRNDEQKADASRYLISLPDATIQQQNS